MPVLGFYHISRKWKVITLIKMSDKQLFWTELKIQILHKKIKSDDLV